MSSTATKSVSRDASLRIKRDEAQKAERKADNIVSKTLRMAETLEKYPKPKQ